MKDEMAKEIKKKYSEIFARAEILFSSKEKAHGMRKFIFINDRLSTLLTPLEGKRTIVRRSRSVVLLLLIVIAVVALPLSVQGQTQIQEQAKTQEQTQAQASNTLPLEDLQVFSEVFGKIKSEYVDEVDDATLLRHAIRGMLSGLDPHSIFLEPADFKKIKSSTTGRFGGLGIEVTAQDGVVKVVTPIDGTPAFDAGIKSGDLILMIDDMRVRDMSFNDAIGKMRGDPGSTVKLTISREGEDHLEIKLVRAIIKTKSVKGEMLEEGLAYVRLSSFTSETAQNLRLKIKQLNDSMRESADKSDKQRLRGLVLDIRNNPGGVLAGAIAVSDMFISAGAIVSTRGRGNTSGQTFIAQAGDILDDAPMVVLVNEGSASASEIVAGALQDHQRAIILGTKTFGKGSVQAIIPMRDGSALKLTTARYYTPLNRSIQATGIVPDIIVEQVVVSQAVEDKAGNDKNARLRESDLSGHLLNTESKDSIVAEDVPSKENIQMLERVKKDQQLREALNLLKGMVLTKHRTPAVGG